MTIDMIKQPMMLGGEMSDDEDFFCRAKKFKDKLKLAAELCVPSNSRFKAHHQKLEPVYLSPSSGTPLVVANEMTDAENEATVKKGNLLYNEVIIDDNVEDKDAHIERVIENENAGKVRQSSRISKQFSSSLPSPRPSAVNKKLRISDGITFFSLDDTNINGKMIDDDNLQVLDKSAVSVNEDNEDNDSDDVFADIKMDKPSIMTDSTTSVSLPPSCARPKRRKKIRITVRPYFSSSLQTLSFIIFTSDPFSQILDEYCARNNLDPSLQYVLVYRDNIAISKFSAPEQFHSMIIEGNSKPKARKKKTDLTTSNANNDNDDEGVWLDLWIKTEWEAREMKGLGRTMTLANEERKANTKDLSDILSEYDKIISTAPLFPQSPSLDNEVSSPSVPAISIRKKGGELLQDIPISNSNMTVGELLQEHFEGKGGFVFDGEKMSLEERLLSVLESGDLIEYYP